MQSSHIMVIMIVLIVMIASIVRAKYGYSRRHGRRETEADSRVASAETERLREDVKMLKERLHVLERITVEKENSLEREIEQLRDR